MLCMVPWFVLRTASWSSPPPGRCAAATGGAALGIRRRLTSIATMAARLLLAAAAAAPPPHPTTPPPSALAPAGAPPAPPPGYVAIPELSDEFDGDSLDATKWSTDPHVIRCDCAAARGPYPTGSLTPRPAPCTQLARPRARALRAVQRPGGGRQAAALGAVRAAQRQLARRLRQLHHERRAEPRRRQGGLLRDTLAQRLVRNQLLLVVP